MDKRFQVFISSTYKDLSEERKSVMEALMNIDCIAAGMELFPAADEEQLNFIKSIIDDSDYYILLIGARYGSLSASGISYTEMEYNYAVERGVYVIALLHGEPGSIPTSKSDVDPVVREKLEAFKEKVRASRLIKTWRDQKELAYLVVASVTRAIRSHPAKGWVRGSAASSEELLSQINDLRLENDRLRTDLAEYRQDSAAFVASLADGDQSTDVAGSHRLTSFSQDRWLVSVTWNELLGAFGPRMLIPIAEHFANGVIAKAVLEWKNKFVGAGAELDEVVFDSIKIQFLALGYISIEIDDDIPGQSTVMWHLTSLGRQTVFEARAAKHSD